MVFDKWFPKRGTMNHPSPPAWWLRHHGVAAWAFSALTLPSRMSRLQSNNYFLLYSWS